VDHQAALDQVYQKEGVEPGKGAKGAKGKPLSLPIKLSTQVVSTFGGGLNGLGRGDEFDATPPTPSQDEDDAPVDNGVLGSPVRVFQPRASEIDTSTSAAAGNIPGPAETAAPEPAAAPASVATSMAAPAAPPNTLLGGRGNSLQKRIGALRGRAPVRQVQSKPQAQASGSGTTQPSSLAGAGQTTKPAIGGSMINASKPGASKGDAAAKRRRQDVEREGLGSSTAQHGGKQPPSKQQRPQGGRRRAAAMVNATNAASASSGSSSSSFSSNLNTASTGRRPDNEENRNASGALRRAAGTASSSSRASAGLGGKGVPGKPPLRQGRPAPSDRAALGNGLAARAGFGGARISNGSTVAQASTPETPHGVLAPSFSPSFSASPPVTLPGMPPEQRTVAETPQKPVGPDLHLGNGLTLHAPVIPPTPVHPSSGTFTGQKHERDAHVSTSSLGHGPGQAGLPAEKRHAVANRAGGSTTGSVIPETPQK